MTSFDYEAYYFTDFAVNISLVEVVVEADQSKLGVGLCYNYIRSIVSVEISYMDYRLPDE